ncbi:hypothetical protein [Polaromonas sp. UC242_47]|uniref:hypothetical protein n=1 Tax=Polaromonas sp. UC242_47 TaxID=3374626 RepID=UPI0037ADBC9C
MPSSKFTYDQPSSAPSPVVREEHIEYGFIGKLQGLKYEYRADIRDRASLERNFREKFEALTCSNPSGSALRFKKSLKGLRFLASPEAALRRSKFRFHTRETNNKKSPSA